MSRLIRTGCINKKHMAERNVGMEAFYLPTQPGVPSEAGTITGWNDSYLFMRFGPGGNSRACAWHTVSWNSEGREVLDRRSF